MSISVGASSNALSYLQSLLQQGTAGASGPASTSDPLSTADAVLVRVQWDNGYINFLVGIGERHQRFGFSAVRRRHHGSVAFATRPIDKRRDGPVVMAAASLSSTPTVTAK